MSANVNPPPVMRTKAMHPDKNEEKKVNLSLVYSTAQNGVYNVPTEFRGRLISRLLPLPQSTAASSRDVRHSFLITCTLTSGIFTLSASAAPANLSSRTESHALVEAASFEFNTFFLRGRLGSHDHAVP